MRSRGYRSVLAAFFVLRTLSTTTTTTGVGALPFGTRGGNAADENGGGGDGGEDENDVNEGEQDVLFRPDDDATNPETLDAVVTDDASGGYHHRIQVVPATGGGGGGSSSDDRIRRSEVVEKFMRFGCDHSSSTMQDEIRTRARNMTDFLVETRRTLHRHPELMYNEKQTSATVQSILRDLGIPYTTGWAVNQHPETIPGRGGYGIVADIGTGQEPCVLLRADMDALPILERTEGIDDFRSERDGKMHACGHDGHTTMLLGAASILKDVEESLEGTVRIMLQPAEEGGAGAKRMREEGVLEMKPKPQFAFGMHVWPTIPSGTIASRPGPLLAAADRFEILVAGVGGHAAMPHLTIDPVVAASAIVMNLQTIVSRTLSPLEAGVCSVTKIEGGDAFNVIPASVLLRGTVRALTTETLLNLKRRVEHVVRATAETHGCNVTSTWSPDYYPPTVNDPTLYDEFSRDVGSMVSEEGAVRDVEPTMGAEDFSFVAESIPSTFFLLGQGSGLDPPTNYGLHHPHFALDESVMPRGVELHVSLALRALRRLSHHEEGGAGGGGPKGMTS